MRQLNIYLAVLFLAASMAFSNPSVAHAQVSIDSGGNIVLNCPVAWAAKASWYMNGPGFLGSTWKYRHINGQVTFQPRSISFMSKGYIFAKMPAMSNYKIESFSWDSPASGFLFTAYCVTNV